MEKTDNGTSGSGYGGESLMSDWEELFRFWESEVNAGADPYPHEVVSIRIPDGVKID